MGNARHKWHLTAIKCVFSVINLILITAQFSYKFYVFASQPLLPEKGNGTVHSKLLPESPFSVDAEHRVMSLDKRYSYKHFFTLDTPVFGIPPLAVTVRKTPSLHKMVCIEQAILYLIPRGPPMA